MELLGILIILLIFAVGVFYFKLPSGVALMFSAVAIAIVLTGNLQIRHLVEGTFGFFDAILIISTAMIFMKVIDATGALSTISYAMMKYFHRWPTLLIIFITFFVMFPGMLTGLSSTCILTTGALVVPGLIAMGMPKRAVGALIAMASVFGMIAPPINIPVMIIGGGVDMPYIGFEKPLLLATIPPAIFTALYFRIKYIRKFDINEVLSKLPEPVYNQYGIKLFIPLIFVIGGMIISRILPQYIPDVGIPLIFIIGAFLGFGTGKKFNFIQLSRTGLRESMPIISILVGVGMLVQIMTLTGIRGYIAVSAIKVPIEFLYPAIVLIMPAFGSAYAAASILGVPLVFVFLGHSEIIITAALSLIAGVADLMPPPSLLCVFAARIVGEENHYQILKKSLWPILFTLATGVLMMIFSDKINLFLTTGFKSMY